MGGPAAEPERLDFLGFRLTCLHADRDSACSVLEWHTPPRAGGPPVHVHDHTEEGFYVLRGQIALLIDDEDVARGPGSYTLVCPGAAAHLLQSGRPARRLSHPDLAAGIRGLPPGARSRARANAIQGRGSGPAQTARPHGTGCVTPPPRRATIETWTESETLRDSLAWLLHEHVINRATRLWFDRRPVSEPDQKLRIGPPHS
jgi:quercetin dioxygenase-like cupin family protein